MTGVVLAGGQSRRFGRNKALASFQGERLLDRALRGLRPWCRSLLVVANDLLPYLSVDAALVRDLVPNQGPLGGIFTALLHSPEEWVLVKATDMPFMVPELIEAMRARRSGADLVVPVRDGFFEPLFACYHVRCLPLIAALLGRGERQIVRFFAGVRVARLEEEQWRPLDPAGRTFQNINTLEEFQRLA